MPKRSNREKIVQEQLNDEKTSKKRRSLILKKNDVRNDKKTTKKRSKTTILIEKKNDVRNDKKNEKETIISYT